MSVDDARALLRLVRRFRAHRWRLAVSRAAGGSLWVSVLILTLMAIVHVTMIPVSPAWVPISALLPPVAGMLFALVRGRPDLETACRIADRQLAAHSLLVSAWELVRGPPPDRLAAPLVIHRAMQRLPYWQSRSGAFLRYPSPRSSTFLAAAILVTAFTVLLIPIEHDPFSGVSTQSKYVVDGGMVKRNPMADVIRSLREAGMESALEVPEERRAGAVGEGGSGKPAEVVKDSHSGIESAETGGENPTGAPLLTQRSPVSPAGSDTTGNPEGSRIGGGIHHSPARSRDKAGNRPDDGTGQAATDKHIDLAVEPVVIRRETPKEQPAAGTGDDGIALKPALPVPGLDSANYPLRKARRPDGVTIPPGFDIAQRVLIDRYFNRLQTEPKP